MSNRELTVNFESGRMWKEAIVACFKVLSQYFLEATVQNVWAFENLYYFGNNINCKLIGLTGSSLISTLFLYTRR
jgi:hypothetical protein